MADIAVSDTYLTWNRAIQEAAILVLDAQRREGELIREAVQDGLTWGEVGSMHFMTRQSAWARWHEPWPES